MGAIGYGDRVAQQVSQRVGAPVADLTALRGMKVKQRVSGMRVMVIADGSRWRWHASSVLTDDGILVANPTDAPTSGRWLREVGGLMLRAPIVFGTLDAAVLLVLQAGMLFDLHEAFWQVTADFTGGSSSAIGVSSNKTNFTTKGDVLGGVGGNVAAALTAAGSPNLGTIGTGFDTVAKRRVLWKPTENFRHDLITSQFTAGAGFVCLEGNLLQNDGA